jgi:type VI secretion system protein ImpK
MSQVWRAPVPSLRLFQQYCALLLDLRRLAKEPSRTDESPVEIAAVAMNAVSEGKQASNDMPGRHHDIGSPVSDRPHLIWTRLVSFLERQLADVSRIAGPVGFEFHREAVYVMAALTDEIFVHMDWEGREFWLSHLVEARFFNTHLAGEQFFRRLDRVLTRDDDAAIEIASVYLGALALGFRGKYWNPSSEETLEAYRTRLVRFISARDPEITECGKRLFPEAYRNTLRSGVLQRLPDSRRWLLVLVGLIVAWLIISQIVWWNLSSDLRNRVCCLTGRCGHSCAPISSEIGK